MPASFALNAVFTTEARNKYARKLGDLFIPTGILSYISYFKVGLGGWNPDSSPRDPSPELTDLDIVLDQSRPFGQKRYPALTAPPYNITFQKTFAPGQLAASTNILTALCEVLNTEYNDDGTGDPPLIWELGLFDIDNVMVVYATFSSIQKTASRSLSFPVRMRI